MKLFNMGRVGEGQTLLLHNFDRVIGGEVGTQAHIEIIGRRGQAPANRAPVHTPMIPILYQDKRSVILSVNEKLPLLKVQYFGNYNRNPDSYFTFRVSGILQTRL